MAWKISPGIAHMNPAISTPESDDPAFNDLRGGRQWWSVFEGLNNASPHPHPEWLPKTFYFVDSMKEYLPIISWRGVFVVQEPVRCIIEAFEPGVHEWFPVDVCQLETKQKLPVKYHILNICQRIESLVLEHPSLAVNKYQLPDGRVKTIWRSVDARKGAPPMRRSAIEGRHLWREYDTPIYQFASDALVSELEAKGFSQFKKDWHSEEIADNEADAFALSKRTSDEARLEQFPGKIKSLFKGRDT